MGKIIGNTTATPNPRPDWLQTDETKADYIKNKPAVLTEDQVKELISEQGGDEQVQADWTQTDNTQVDYIKNKPDIPTEDDIIELISTHTPDAQIQADWEQADNSKVDYIKNKPTLGALASKDEIVKGDLSSALQIEIDGKANSGDIPTKVSELDNDENYLTSYTETDPTVPDWAKADTKPSYTYDEVGADPEGSADEALESANKYTDDAIAPVDAKTVDKIGYINSGMVSYVSAENDGIMVTNTLTIVDKSISNTFTEASHDTRIPIVPGNNVTFTADTTNNVVSINASSGLPTHSTANNGQFLSIVNGVPAWVTIEDGDEVSY